ncbi:MAG: bifunctional DNA primase/polymerase [Saprospiraceae bacterium]|nr:bifunctional DNA primase/polymerase [Saprospiraceae bacterium]
MVGYAAILQHGSFNDLVPSRTRSRQRGRKPPKSPIGNWKSAQEIRFTEASLAIMMHKAKVRISPAIVCGKVSGNLEVIDVDVKHWPGIDTRFFSEIEKLYPELFTKLRIHKTMSGGFHVLYRGEEPFNEGNKKLACKKNSKEAGIETRGEGGIILCPPGNGYSVFQNVPIPTISKAERDSLITIARMLEENIKVVTPKKARSHESVYSENPFDQFNSSADAEQILLEYGWTKYSETSNFIYYSKPDKKTPGVSASWIKDKRIYHIFTTGSDLDPDKCNGNYSPSSVLIQLKFKGDSKAAYKFLVDSGYGKFHPNYEARKVKAYVQMPGKEPPANFSPEAKKKIKEERIAWEKKYPYGIFWELIEEFNIYKISLTRIIEVGNALGIARYNNRLIHIEKPYFRFIEENECQTILSKYIKEDHEDYIKINDALLKIWKQYSEFLSSRTEVHEIMKEEVLRSAESIEYKVFLNGVLEITNSGYELCSDFTKYGKLICSDDIIHFNFVKQIEEDYLNCKYVKFLRFAISNELKYIQKCIGFLSCDFKSRGKGFLIAALEDVKKARKW